MPGTEYAIESGNQQYECQQCEHFQDDRLQDWKERHCVMVSVTIFAVTIVIVPVATLSTIADRCKAVAACSFEYTKLVVV